MVGGSKEFSSSVFCHVSTMFVLGIFGFRRRVDGVGGVHCGRVAMIRAG